MAWLDWSVPSDHAKLPTNRQIVSEVWNIWLIKVFYVDVSVKDSFYVARHDSVV